LQDGADHNEISHNSVAGSESGLHFFRKGEDNEIHANRILNNAIGLSITDTLTQNNRLLHNDLFNAVNAHDVSVNAWDDGYPSGGNFWSDYSGLDADGDGIGDTPYTIPGGGNQDRYPQMAPYTGGLLGAGTRTVSAATGGSVRLDLFAGSANAGRTYLVAGSASGFHPGITLPGSLRTLPLNWDWLSPIILTSYNNLVFQDFRGTLSAGGAASAQLNLPPLPPSLVGERLFFAFVLTDAWGVVSNPVLVEIVE